jgi:hypothetical protein
MIFRFLKMTRENLPFGDSFYQDFNLFDCTDEEKLLWQPQIEATYIGIYHRVNFIYLP